MQNLIVSEDDDHGQQTSQSFKVTFQKDIATNGIGRYQIKDKDDEKQISGSTVTSALNATQLTF